MTSYELHDGAIFFSENKLLALSDLHLGYEAELRRKGMMFPANEFKILERRIRKILVKTKPKKIVINGDFKHSFGYIHNDEWKHAKQIIDLFLDYGELILIAGNHDNLAKPLAEKNGVVIMPEYQEGEILFMHGDKLPKGKIDAEIIVIGHQHPAISIRDGARQEIIKCYLVGKWKRKKLIVLPSMFSLTEGLDLLKSKIITPFIKKLDNFEVIGLDKGEILPFGAVKDLMKLD